jgi:TolB protein
MERNGDILLLDPETGETENISGTREFADSQPAWSPDGEQIAFAGCSECTRSHLFLMDADGSSLQQLTFGPQLDLNPSWSPDGRLIAFQRGDGVSAEVWIVTLATGRAEPLPRFDLFGFSGTPSWSPDGTMLAFEVADSITRHIAIMGIGGSGQRVLTDQEFEASSPAWSPDGRLIAFRVMDDQGRFTIWTMTPSGTELRTVAQGGSFTWSPDGKSIAVVQAVETDPTKSRVVIMNSDGTADRAVTSIAASDGGHVGSVAWQPLPSEA